MYSGAFYLVDWRIHSSTESPVGEQEVLGFLLFDEGLERSAMGSRALPIQVNTWPHLEGAGWCSSAGFHVTAPLSLGLRDQAAPSAATPLLTTHQPLHHHKSLFRGSPRSSMGDPTGVTQGGFCRAWAWSIRDPQKMFDL